MLLAKDVTVEGFVAYTYVTDCTTSPTTALRDPSSKCTLHLPVVFNTAHQNFTVIGYTLKTSLTPSSRSKPEFQDKKERRKV
jgi:hypothetical protein